jgi:hypothetical protein
MVMMVLTPQWLYLNDLEYPADPMQQITYAVRFWAPGKYALRLVNLFLYLGLRGRGQARTGRNEGRSGAHTLAFQWTEVYWHDAFGLQTSATV